MYGYGFYLLIFEYVNHDSMDMDNTLCDDSSSLKMPSNEFVLWFFFSSLLFFYANRDWKEDISYLSSPVKLLYPCTYVKKKIILQAKVTDTLSRTERLPY